MSPWEEWDRKVSGRRAQEKHEVMRALGRSAVPTISFVLAVLAVAIAW
jgi:hypothetical protein